MLTIVLKVHSVFYLYDQKNCDAGLASSDACFPVFEAEASAPVAATQRQVKGRNRSSERGSLPNRTYRLKGKVTLLSGIFVVRDGCFAHCNESI